jgi:hypothetical protein
LFLFITLKIDTVIEIYDRERNFRQTIRQTIRRTTSLDPGDGRQYQPGREKQQ